MKKTLLLLFTLVLASFNFQIQSFVRAQSINLTLDPPKTVPYVEINKYLGTWYEQASIPFYFQRNCQKTTATYSLNSDQSMRVDNVCYRNGVKQESIGKAIPDPDDIQRSNAKLKVQFDSSFGVQADYWIVRLDDEDYTYSVVSTPMYNYLWILYRQPHMPDTLFQAIYQDLQKDGFSVDKLVKTIQ